LLISCCFFYVLGPTEVNDFDLTDALGDRDDGRKKPSAGGRGKSWLLETLLGFCLFNYNSPMSHSWFGGPRSLQAAGELQNEGAQTFWSQDSPNY
jgi:hypothetical protein